MIRTYTRHRSRLAARTEALESRTLAAIDPLAIANTATAGSSITSFADAGDRLYFNATTSVTGSELWSTDGTVTGTRLVADVTPGTASTYFRALVAGNGHALVTDQPPALNATEVRFTDGAATGATTLVASVASSSSVQIAASGDLFLYGVYDGTASKLYRVLPSDPTAPTIVGTYPGLISVPMAGTGATADSLFFYSGNVIYRVDASGAVSTLSTLTGTGNTPTKIRAITGTHVYVETTAKAVRAVRVSDGVTTTLATTTTGFGFGNFTTLSGNRVEYVLDHNQYISNGSVTTMLGLSTYSLPQVAELNGQIILTGYDTTSNDEELYAYTPASGTTPASTRLIKDINPGATNSSAAFELTQFNGKVYFFANDGSHGTELWQTDGTTSGTLMVVDAMPGTDSGGANYGERRLPVINGRLLTVISTRATGAELFTLDASPAAQPQLVRDINIAPAALPPNQQPASIRLGDRLLFAFDDYVSGTGTELWTTDGTTAGTHEVADLAPGPNSSYPESLVRFRGGVIFGDALGRLWRSDGTTAGTRLVASLGSRATQICVTAADDHALVATRANGVFRLDAGFTLSAVAAEGAATISYAHAMAEVSPGHLVMQANDTVNGDELWTLDAGTGLAHRLGNHFAGDGSGSYVLHFTDGAVVRGGVYYAIIRDAELWRTDGTEAGTYKISDATASTGTPSLFDTTAGLRMIRNDNMYAVIDAPSAPLPLVYAFTVYSTQLPVPWNEHTYLTASSRASIDQLYVTDGTAAGTGPTKVLGDGSTNYPTTHPIYLTATDDAIFFTAFTPTAGRELWRSDGTAAGTVQVDDFIPGSGDGNIFPIGQAGNYLVMLATSPTLGRQLFRTAVDIQGPRLTSGTLEHAAAGPAVRLAFDERVAGPLAAADFVVTNLATGATLSSAAFTLEPDGSTDGPSTLRLRFASGLPDGPYSVRLRANAAADRWGNAVASDQTITFTSLAGDANDDGVVDFSDLLIVARNYGSTGKSYAQGNLDASADGSVDFGDLLVLARHYGMKLPPLTAAAAMPIVSAPSSAKSTRRPGETAELV